MTLTSNIIVGLIAIVLGIWGLLVWWDSFGMVMRGLIPFLLIVFGVLAIGSKYYSNQAVKTDNKA